VSRPITAPSNEVARQERQNTTRARAEAAEGQHESEAAHIGDDESEWRAQLGLITFQEGHYRHHGHKGRLCPWCFIVLPLLDTCDGRCFGNTNNSVVMSPSSVIVRM